MYVHAYDRLPPVWMEECALERSIALKTGGLFPYTSFPLFITSILASHDPSPFFFPSLFSPSKIYSRLPLPSFLPPFSVV